MAEAGRSPNIEILTLTDVIKVKGKPGNFEVTLKINPRYIDPEKCRSCGDCTKFCQAITLDWFNVNLSFTKATHIDSPQAIPSTYYIDPNACLKLAHNKPCEMCLEVCTSKAIDFDQKPLIKNVKVGAIILAPGSGIPPYEILEKYGYGKYKDILHTTEVERLTSVSGPTEGEFIKETDFKPPEKIAFLQCIGSRDVRNNRLYCSSICCAISIKQAIVIKEHYPSCDITFFFIDVRSPIKELDKVFEEAIEKYNFKILKTRPGKIYRKNNKINIHYVDEKGKLKIEPFDMVILSTGLSPPEDAQEIAKIFKIDLNEFGFAKTSSLNPCETTSPGIYIAGTFQGPKDIHESVVQASSAAAYVSELLKDVRFSSIIEKSYPPEDEELLKTDPRVGVFLCHCGSNIAGTIDMESLEEYAKNLPNVITVERGIFTCSQDFLEKIKEKIKEYKLNRIVVASCTPRTHEPIFKSTLKEAGLNPALFEMANIREQCSWIHYDDPKKATEKAKDLIRMAVFKAQKLSPVTGEVISNIPSALVIGGGVAGLTSALSIAEQGFKVYLVEKGKSLGGQVKKIKSIIDGENLQTYLNQLIKKTKTHPNIKIYTEAQIEDISGYTGNYKTSIKFDDKKEIIDHSIIVIATGGKEYRPAKYPINGKTIITQLDLEKILYEEGLNENIKKVVMIQCAGSRGDELDYCSKVCCIHALKNAMNLKKLNNEIDVFILYRDIRAYGFYEKYYLEARKMGIKFIRFPDKKRPKIIRKNKKFKVKVYDTLLLKELELYPDLIVLSVGIVPEKDEHLLNIFKNLGVYVDEYGFLKETHIKIKPVETPTEGIFICGLAHKPQPLPEVINEAKACAAKAGTFLVKKFIEIPPIYAEVDINKCIGCGICKNLCPFFAIEMIKLDKKKKAQIIKALCKGCGVCASHCPVFAIEIAGFYNDALLEQIRTFKIDLFTQQIKEAKEVK
uniref:CoB--CoM heterodisulfide reductase iron-sulfur subunit A family protein n=1 Tax=Thermodesulfobacterium geofontis TaxID=1295609 RepID=A0A7V5K3I9_9BACT